MRDGRSYCFMQDFKMDRWKKKKKEKFKEKTKEKHNFILIRYKSNHNSSNIQSKLHKYRKLGHFGNSLT